VKNDILVNNEGEYADITISSINNGRHTDGTVLSAHKKKMDNNRSEKNNAQNQSTQKRPDRF